MFKAEDLEGRNEFRCVRTAQLLAASVLRHWRELSLSTYTAFTMNIWYIVSITWCF